MKSNLIHTKIALLVLGFFPSFIFSQTYFPLPGHFAFWTFCNDPSAQQPDYDCYDNNDFSGRILELYGEQVIAGKTWKKVYTNDWGSLYLNYYIREEGKKVYGKNIAGDTSSILMFDFNLIEGDTFQTKIIYSGIKDASFVIDSIREFVTNTGPRRIFYPRLVYLQNGIPSGCANEKFWWIEGIGSNFGPVYPWYFGFCYGLSEYRLACFHDNEDLVFGGTNCEMTMPTPIDEMESLPSPHSYPNPVYDQAVLEFPGRANVEYFEIIDQQGRIVRSIQRPGRRFLFLRDDLPAGIYFLRAHYENKDVGSLKISIQ